MGRLIGAVDMNLFSTLILCYLFARAFRRMDRGQPQNKIFTFMLGSTILMLLVDALAFVVDGWPGRLAFLSNQILCLLYYLFSPSVAALGFFYIQSQIDEAPGRMKRLKRIIIVFYVLYCLFILVSALNGWSYYIDQSNVYHRGPFSYINAIIMLGLMLGMVLFLLLKGKALPKSRLLTLLFILVPPLIGGTLQAFFSGILCLWPCIALSLMLIYINIQDQNLGIDYLTGAHNRRQLDYYLSSRIQSAAKPFTALMVDINDFKTINDTLGHQTGDEALIKTVEVLRSCLRISDVIARYGGDEFLVISNIESQQGVEAVAQRIRTQYQRFNNTAGKPYELNFSIGCAVYQPGSGLSAEQFLKLLDTYMYEDKKKQQN